MLLGPGHALTLALTLDGGLLHPLAGVGAGLDALDTMPVEAERAERDPSSLRSSTRLNLRAKRSI
jgi:hypothetical protein